MVNAALQVLTLSVSGRRPAPDLGGRGQQSTAALRVWSLRWYGSVFSWQLQQSPEWGGAFVAIRH